MELTKIRHITIYICEISKLDAAFIEVICSFKLWGEILEKNWGNFCESYVIVKPSGCSCNRFAICIIEKKFTTLDPRSPVIPSLSHTQWQEILANVWVKWQMLIFQKMWRSKQWGWLQRVSVLAWEKEIQLMIGNKKYQCKGWGW